MLQNLIESVNKLPDNEIKSALVAELVKIKAEIEKSKQENSKVPNLELILSDNKYADLKRELTSWNDTNIGKVRTKWETENKIKTENPETPDLLTKMQEYFESKLNPLNEQIQKLSGQKKVEDNNTYAMKKIQEMKLKNPEKIMSLLKIAESTKTEDIDNQITNIQSVFKEFNANFTTTPPEGNGDGGDSASSLVKSVVAERVNSQTDK